MLGLLGAVEAMVSEQYIAKKGSRAASNDILNKADDAPFGDKGEAIASDSLQKLCTGLQGEFQLAPAPNRQEDL